MLTGVSFLASERKDITPVTGDFSSPLSKRRDAPRAEYFEAVSRLSYENAASAGS
jgi:hypothetical protein